MNRVIFVSGIDTDIGKTYATAFLIRRLRNEGLRVISQKMVQTGCTDGLSEDILLHRKLLGDGLLPEDLRGLTCPLTFRFPSSPHLAAEKEGCTIDCTLIDKATDALLTQGYDRILMEGAGGLMVPIHRGYHTLDFIAERAYPLALVTSGRLGSINHTLMSLELCLRRGINAAYLLYNRYSATDPIIDEDTFAYFNEYLRRNSPRTIVLEVPKMQLSDNPLTENRPGNNT